jgi:ribosomal protein S18 acetylase RimI-like enzyme
MIAYIDSVEAITPDQLEGFFVGWLTPPSSGTHLQLLANSDYIVLAVDDEAKTVIGYVTAVSDNVLAAYIPNLEVLPAYQGRGIGSELMQRMLEKLQHLYAVDLICDPELQPFYARLGMTPYSGMIIRNYEQQSGAP